MDYSSTHQWVPPEGRALEIEGKDLKHHRCDACKRDFLEEVASGERYAVKVFTFSFERLSAEVSDRWLRSPCPRHPPVDDEEDRRTRFREPA
jgi:hypothetical protein